MYLTEQHIINKNHELFTYCNTICSQSKNLYNLANYYIRQEFIKNKKWLRYQDLDKLLKNTKDYRLLKAECSQQILRLLDKNWISFFNSIKNYNQNKYLGKPKLPKYKNKNSKNIVITSQNLTIENNKIRLPMLLNENMINLSIKDKNQYYKDNKLKRSYIKTKQNNIKQIRIVPKTNNYVIELIYEIKEKEFINNDRYLSIDIGLNNLATCVNNIGLNPFVINGKIIKSYNYYYNKQKSKIQSELKKVNNKDWSNKLSKLTLKRNNKIKNYMHKSSRYIINYCLQNDITNIVIGKNKEWKQEINLGKRNNQNFVQIPFNIFIYTIEYKAKLRGINIILTEESYTSKCSFIDDENICKHENYKGKRITRGLFISDKKIKINADINGSYNILRKVKPELLYSNMKGIMDVVLHPIIVNL